MQRQVGAVCAEQAQADRNDEGLFVTLTGGGRAALRERQGVLAGCSVVVALGMHTRCAGLAVPTLELRQQTRQIRSRVGVGNGLGKVVAGHGLAVVAAEVQRQAFGKAGATHQGLHHANHLGTFFVNGDGVEIIDFDVTVRPHRVGHRAGVFGELGGAQHAHVFNPFDGARRGLMAKVLRKLLIAEHRQALFQAELEPITAGHAVTGPVVKVLVTDHALDVAEVGVGCGRLAGQYVLGVEDVQALVLHGAHVEIAGGHNHEALQVQRQAKARFVPCHRGHQRIHGVLCFVQVARAHIDLQQMRLPVARGDALLARHQLAGHQRKQVTGFFVRVHPLGEMPAIIQQALLDLVAIGQQYRVLGLVCAQRHGVAGHHVGTV